LIAGTASAQNWSAQRSDQELEYRLELLDGEVQALRQELGVSGNAAPGGGSSAEVLRRLSEIEVELRRLTGEVERMRFRVDQLSEEAARRLGDVEFRLTELEGGDVAALPTRPAPLGGGTGTPVAPQVSVSEQRALDDGIRLVQQGRFRDADLALGRFLDDYPSSPLLPRAHFWLGEAAFTRGNFSRAARSFLAGYNANENGADAPDNLMKLGVSLARLGQTQEACLTLAEVSRRFPRSGRAVSEAESEASRLSCG
ncbi:MAG: tol-pal system protein YbgF, partial [Pseudomonadota bacterium]